ncbi:response regulator [Bacillus sp. FJAT-49736]|uniref:response regulator n=1 Tax=Bacillus sp. FJAT-49736 TaxID=2833582 RepID=UPI001BC9A3A4|nr:response regulator [Bacillus sp. FJAT-49736]
MQNNLKVLICDDSTLIRKKLKDILKRCKCEEVFESENGNKAVEMAKLYSPDIVFMDIIMPEKDGIEALKEIREWNPDVKVVMVSSVGTNQHLKRALENGAIDFIQKPVTLEAVTNVLTKVLEEGNVNV